MSAHKPLYTTHECDLMASAIASEVRAERGYYSESTKARLGKLGFSQAQQITPTLVIPIMGLDGEVVGYQHRPDTPRRNKAGKEVKYETLPNWRMRLDAHPRARVHLGDPKRPLFITEGIKKGDAAVSKGLCAIALLGVWNWRGTNEHGGKAVLADWEQVALNGRKVYVAFDSDAMVKPEVHQALDRLTAWLRTKGAEVFLIYLPSLAGGAKCGLDDFFAASNFGKDRRTVDDLLALASPELRRPTASSKPAKVKTPDGPREPTGPLLDDVHAYLRRYMIVSDKQAEAITLWILHTHTFQAVGSTPYLNISSAEMESGKTQLLEVLDEVVARPWLTGRVTAAVLPRKIDKVRPTLLLDESDTAFGSDQTYAEALRGVLNTGYRASGKTTVCVGQGADIDFRDFATFCPKAIAGLNTLPDTVASRAIPIRLTRRLQNEIVAEWFPSEEHPDATALKERLEVWAAQAVDELANEKPDRPHGLRDRAFDVWRPLLAIAASAGSHVSDGHNLPWVKRAEEAATELSSKDSSREAGSHGVQLLGALRKLFDDMDRQNLWTKEILVAINADDDLPFGGWRKGEGINARKLAQLLATYEIKSKSVRIPNEDKTGKGYERNDFNDAFARYLPSQKGTSGTTQTQSQKTADFKTAQDPNVPDEKQASNPHKQRDVPDVPDRTLNTGADTNGGGHEEWLDPDEWLDRAARIFDAPPALEAISEEWAG